MPRLSDSMEEGTILKWLVAEGGEVKRGQPLVEIETDKANMTYESDTDGTVSEIVASEGDTLADRRGDRAHRREAAARRSRRSRRSRRTRSEQDSDEEERRSEPEEDAGAATSDGAKSPSGDAEPSSNGGERVKASPVARRMAGEMGVELARARGLRARRADRQGRRGGRGQGRRGGREREKDEDRKQPPRKRPAPKRGEAGAKGEVEVHELTRLQQTVIRRMAESKATAPDFELASTWTCRPPSSCASG